VEKDRVRLFLATASGTPWYHREYMAGCIDATHTFKGHTSEFPFLCPVVVESIYVEKNRDLLSELFLKSDATHMLFVDTDIGFRARHIATLLEEDRDIISGTYIKKQKKKKVVGTFIDSEQAKIKECYVVPAGFLLIKKETMKTLAEKYPETHRIEGVDVHCLWQPYWKTVDGVKLLERDDVAFSRRCRDAGLKLWMHCGVILPHFGEKAYSLIE
jgi:hypothetical protein